MLKLGVCNPRQFYATPPSSWLAYVYYRLSRSRVSLDLLGTAAQSTEATLFERLMPHVRLSNGVFRTTFRQRFRNLDPIVNRVIQERFSPADNPALEVEDWAASACLTSGEWAQTVLELYPRATLVASDLLLFLIAVEEKGVKGTFVAEPDGRLLQYIRAPFVIRMAPPEPWLMPLNRVEYLRARSRWQKAQRLWPLPDRWLDGFQWEAFEKDGYILHKLPLIHPEALALAREDARFSIRRQSIFEPARSPVHVIRSMNILNRNYFSEELLKQATRAAIGSLRDGGLWVVGRTMSENPPVHEVTIFRKLHTGRLQVIGRIGAGSEVTDIALSV